METIVDDSILDLKERLSYINAQIEENENRLIFLQERRQFVRSLGGTDLNINFTLLSAKIGLVNDEILRLKHIKNEFYDMG